MPGATTDDLLARARRVRANALAPHSGFAVGAAGTTADGRVVLGVNVESASYPVGVCAETTLVAAAATAGVRPGELTEVVVTADELVAPCGRCRQLLFEFGGPDLVVNGRAMSWWLPDAFAGPDPRP